MVIFVSLISAFPKICKDTEDQVLKDKYHMISPINGTKSREQTSKQNITRDIEIKN